MLQRNNRQPPGASGQAPYSTPILAENAAVAFDAFVAAHGISLNPISILSSNELKMMQEKIAEASGGSKRGCLLFGVLTRDKRYSPHELPNLLLSGQVRCNATSALRLCPGLPAGQIGTDGGPRDKRRHLSETTGMPSLAPKPKPAAKSRAGVIIRLDSDGRFIVARKKAPAKTPSKVGALAGTLKPMSVKEATRAAEKAGILTRSGNLSGKYKK